MQVDTDLLDTIRTDLPLFPPVKGPIDATQVFSGCM